MAGELATTSAPSLWRRLGALGEVPAAVGVIGRMVRDLAQDVRTVMATPAPAPSSFVSVLVAGTCEGKAIFLGRSVDLEGTLSVEVGPVQRPIDDATVIVFADMRRVDVRGIFVGVDLMQGALGECPIARVSRPIPPGMKIQVLCELRR